MSIVKEAIKRGRGRPPKNQSRAEEKIRPTRTPVSGDRDILTVEGKDDEYVYRWVRDDDEAGIRIYKFQQGGWEFVPSNKVIIGAQNVYKSKREDVGSIVRKQDSSTTFLYLMRIRREFYEEDQLNKQKEIDATEEAMLINRDSSNPDEDGQYGSTKISYS